MMEYLPPLIGKNGILVYIFENLHLVSATINVKPILVSDECVVCSCLGNHMNVLSGLSYLIPLFLLNFVLKEVVKVGASLASIPSEEIERISVRDGASS